MVILAIWAYRPNIRTLTRHGIAVYRDSVYISTDTYLLLSLSL